MPTRGKFFQGGGERERGRGSFYKKRPSPSRSKKRCGQLFVVAGGLAVVVGIGAAFGQAGLTGGLLLALTGA